MTQIYMNGRYVNTRNNGPREMSAKFPGKCIKCAERIEVGTTIMYNGKAWHKSCPDITEALNELQAQFNEGLVESGDEFIRNLKQVTARVIFQRLLRKLPPRKPTPPTPTKAEEVAAPAESTLIQDGRYTIVFPDGDYRTLRVKTNKQEGSPFFGKHVVGYLSGPDNGSDYTSCAFLGDDGKAHMWKRFSGDSRLAEAVRVLEDPAKAEELGLAYALKSNNCWKCGRELTRYDSIERGLGKICAENV